jgi:hypothetical protein
MSNNKLEINLLEENEIGFKLKIEGSDSEIASNKPKIRFTITESKSGKGWIFNTERKSGEDNIVVSIPSMKGIVTESDKYSGKLEVIFGNKYFTPTEVDIKFVEPIKVEAAIINRNSQKLQKSSIENEDELLVESVIESVISKQKPIIEQKPAPVIIAQPSTISYNNLPENDKTEINKLFIKKCNGLGITNPQKHLKEGTEQTKNKLMFLFGQITKDYINNQ